MLRKSREGGVARQTQNRKFKSLDDLNVLLNVEPHLPYFGQGFITLFWAGFHYSMADLSSSFIIITFVHLKEPNLTILFICRNF